VLRFAPTGRKGVGMPPVPTLTRANSGWLWRAAASVAIGLAALFLVACGGEEEPSPTGSELAERWLRAGEESTAGVAVYERALPPYFVDLLNPDRDADTPEEDLIAFPVHPEGELLGSYLLRRVDGSQITWLFYDVPESSVGDTMDVVSGQLDASPWQVLSRSGSRSNRILGFENTRNEDITGNAIVEPVAQSEEFTLVVERDDEEVTLTLPRAASVPLIEASYNNGLLVEDVFPGFAQDAGLQEGDQIVRVGETEVSDAQDLHRALQGLNSGAGTVSLLYLIQFAPPPQVEPPPFVTADGLALPSEFPAQEAWDGLLLDSYEVSRDASGRYFFAALFSEDTPTAVANVVRDGLQAAGWEITSDEAAGFGTNLEYVHEDDGLVGVASIDESALDETLTQVLVQIQTAPAQ